MIEAMKNRCVWILLLVCQAAWGQGNGPEIRFEGSDVVARMARSMPVQQLDSTLCSFGTCLADIDSLWESAGRTTPMGWKLTANSNEWLVLRKPVDALEGSIGEDGVITSDSFDPQPDVAIYFETNALGLESVTTNEGKTTFRLEGNSDAENIFLAGSFNGWNPTSLPLKKTAAGWETALELPAGRYLYKFIVDGKWMADPANKRSEPDGFYGKNSVYIVPNHSFILNGYPKARKVIVTGSFNGWYEKELRMERKNGRWERQVYLADDTHRYKFIVDGEWMLDPENPMKRDDGMGNENSILQLGKAVVFRLEGFDDAERVVLSGGFNLWNPDELVMERRNGGWEIAYVLGKGIYEYKFLVDGRWMVDPNNPVTNGDGDFKNSVLSVGPTVTFRLDGFTTASEVLLSGNFNGWSETGYTMQRAEDGWEIELFLHPGKYLYKFIVDGNWIADPGNPLYEGNEFGEYNSIRWVEAPRIR